MNIIDKNVSKLISADITGKLNICYNDRKAHSFCRFAFHAVSDQSRNYKIACPELLRRNSSPGGSREDKDAKEEAVLKSEKLNYIAVKNDARGFSV